MSSSIPETNRTYMKKLLTTAVIILITTSLTFAQDTAKADGILSSATVYFGYGAELTHNAKVNVTTGTKQIVINQLSTNIDINSVQISLPENTALLSQQFSVFTPTVPVVLNPAIKKLQDSIKLYQKEQARNRNLVLIQQETLEKTNKLIELAITKAENNTISSAEALKLITANTEKIEKARTALYELNDQYAALNDKIAALQTKINEAQEKPAKAPKPYGQLTLQVICSHAGEVPV